MLETILFGTFSGLLVVSAMMVIASSEPIHGVLWLVLSFVSAASLWILLHAEFLGLIVILVYVGAILTLFLFVIMTFPTTLHSTLSTSQPIKRYGLSTMSVLAGLGCLLVSVYHHSSHFSVKQPKINGLSASLQVANTEALGLALYTDYIYPFELAGMVLLTAVIVSISLHSGSHIPHHQPTKSPKKREQLQIQPKDRIKLVSGDN